MCIRDRGFPHCQLFLIAATRRCGARVSVLLCPAILTNRITVIDLVGRYPTDYLIVRTPLLRRIVTSFTRILRYETIEY